jgi:oxygen-independent coproporphyrinogen III oxidase
MGTSVSRFPSVIAGKPNFAPPRAAYVHVPFCRHRCGYCNFTLVAGRDDLMDAYLRAIEIELNRSGSARHERLSRVDDLGGRRTACDVDTLYFGGGTPTYLDPERFRRLAAAVLFWHSLAEGYEWTVEANPADIDEPMIETLASLGVTRLSLGGQSFRGEKLRLLERDHEAGRIEQAVRLARGAGMHIGLDLIFAAPGETLEQWSADLDAAIQLAPDHLSTYGITWERGTAFWSRRLRGDLVEVEEELQRDMYGLAIDKLSAAGFIHYEISNFAKPGRRSRHNQTYWSGDSYFAAGPGAARYVDGVREINHRSSTTYLRRVLAGESPVAERETLSPEARARELLVFGLRRLEGVSRRGFAQRTGYEVEELIARPLQKFVALSLLSDDGVRIRLTREGLFVSDALWPEML